MKTNFLRSTGPSWAAACLLTSMIILDSCKKNSVLNGDAIKNNFSQVNLVASASSFAGARVDPNLVNGWGIAMSPTGIIWVSSEDAGKIVVYDKAGVEKLPAVSIPTATAASGGSPTGQVFNGSSDFVLPNGSPARFIFAGTDGVISGWSSGTAALKAVDRSSTSAYLGLAMASSGGNNYLYAADFRSGAIDVFDKNFALVSMSFIDPELPGGYAPFNIQNVGGLLYVMYAKVDAETHEEEKGAGLGYVDVFDTDGSFLRRFASGGALNAPWGIAMTPASYLDNVGAAILIGNFGDGRINAYDMSGNYIGYLKSNGQPVEIDGLWGISFAPATATTIDPNWLFFAAGPNDEAQGLFGYITK